MWLFSLRSRSLAFISSDRQAASAHVPEPVLPCINSWSTAWLSCTAASLT
jgi:hypothetical protein